MLKPLSTTMLWISLVLASVTNSLPNARAEEELMEIEMAPSRPGSEDLLMESTPVKPHENVYIEDVEAQLAEAREEVIAARKEVQKSEAYLKKIKARNYGDNKKLQGETVQAIEKKKKADATRMRVEAQRAKLQSEILAHEKKRARAKERARKAQENLERSRQRLVEAMQNRKLLSPKRKVADRKKKKTRRVRVNFAEETKGKKELSADAH